MRRMRLLVLASIVALTFGACSDQPSSPVEPNAEGLAGKKGPDGCLLPPARQAIADGIRDDIQALFPGKKGPNAPTEQLNNITRKLCEGHYADALDMAWEFLALVNDKNPDNFSGSPADAAQLASDVFALVAAAPNPAPSPFEIPAGAFDETGGIIVFDPDEVTLPFVAGTRNREAAVVVDAPNIFPPGTGQVTIVLARDPGSVMTPFGEYIPGFQAFEEGYEILSSHQPWSEGPGILVALCGVPPLPSDAAIGHLHETGVSLLVPTVPAPDSLGYIDCSAVDPYPFGGGGTFLSMDDGPAWTQVARRVVRPIADFLSPPLLQAEAVALAAAGRGLGGRTQSLSLNAPVDPVIDVDEEIQLSVGTDATWTSDDTDIATVDSDGLVTGEGAGTATITADFTGISGPETLTIVITVEGDGEVLNGLIVFTSERDNGNAEVYVMDADGGNQTNLTNDNFASDREPT
ncbi:MAG: Ig-like domain-containing protein, partial [Gemmatimonadota bacterium]